MTSELRCNLNAELDPKTQICLLSYVKGLKVDVILPNLPNARRSYKVVGLLDSAANFL